MSKMSTCPICGSFTFEHDGVWRCPTHGVIEPEPVPESPAEPSESESEPESHDTADVEVKP
jgi:uncharacterized Zn finger protein (UPF0148 family)